VTLCFESYCCFDILVFYLILGDLIACNVLLLLYYHLCNREVFHSVLIFLLEQCIIHNRVFIIVVRIFFFFPFPIFGFANLVLTNYF